MSNYQGHHGQHQALQNHSVGDIYPLAVVAYDNGGGVFFTLENLTRGTCACDKDGNLHVWLEAANAQRYALWHSRGIRAPEDEAVIHSRAPSWFYGRPVFERGMLVMPQSSRALNTTPPRILAPGCRPSAVPLTPYQEYQRVMEIDNA